tara:strand:- start:10527 stop:10943 length:417 start_codon:yes stop_codon:yes gene_type:complete
MFKEAKTATPWDLTDKKSQKSRFSNQSFYLVVDSFTSESVRQACKAIKRYVSGCNGVRVRGPKAMPTERRRYMVMREIPSSDGGKGLYMTKPLRYRNVMLVIKPDSGCINGLINLTLPSDVNIKIEPYANQYELREDR